MDKIKKSELEEIKNRCIYWEKEAQRLNIEREYYRTQLAKAHEILGRVIHQFSERWDSVRITSYFPTNNLYNKRTTSNPGGLND